MGDVPDPVSEALTRRAARSSRSMASEIRCILQEAVAPTRMPAQVVRSIDRVR